jgi:hypothetical protein
MKIYDLRAAILEAERFLKKAKEVRVSNYAECGLLGGKETSACLRSSMDLTRALATLRRGGS